MTEGIWDHIEDTLAQITESDRWKEMKSPAFMFFPNSSTSGLSIIDGGPIPPRVDPGMVNMKPCDIPRALFKIAEMVGPPKEREWQIGDIVQHIEGKEFQCYLLKSNVPAKVTHIREDGCATINVYAAIHMGHEGGWIISRDCGRDNWRNLTVEAEAGEATR
jgi:hypothetical protein